MEHAQPSNIGGSDLRVRLWRPHDAVETARIWKQALHDEGLTSHIGRNQPASALQHDVAVALIRQYERKHAAAAAARDIRREAAQFSGLQASDVFGNLRPSDASDSQIAGGPVMWPLHTGSPLCL